MLARLATLTALTVLAAVLVFSTPVAPAAAQTGVSDYRLGTGDQVRITVFGHEDLSGEFAVGSSGGVTLPLIGEIQAAGRPPHELETQIIAKLKPDYLKNPQVSVEVLNYRPFYIIGEVKNPGSYSYVGGMRVVNAIAMAGGFTYRAREGTLYITRASNPNGKAEQVNQDAIVLPGDVIRVPERFF